MKMKFAGLIFWAAKCNGSCPHTETHGDHGIREFNRAFGILMLKIKDRDLQMAEMPKYAKFRPLERHTTIHRTNT